MVQSGHIERAMGVFERECKLKDLAKISFEEKQNMVKEISRMQI